MIPAQPLLIFVLVVIVGTYFKRFRSRLFDRVIIFAVFGCALFLVLYPDFATRLAHMIGIGRGVDLVFYLAIPGLAFLVIILFSRMREVNAILTAIIREQALSAASQQPLFCSREDFPAQNIPIPGSAKHSQPSSTRLGGLVQSCCSMELTAKESLCSRHGCGGGKEPNSLRIFQLV